MEPGHSIWCIYTTYIYVHNFHTCTSFAGIAYIIMYFWWCSLAFYVHGVAEVDEYRGPQSCAPASHQRHSAKSRSLCTPNLREHINRANRCRRAVAHTHVSYRKKVDKIHICGHVHVCEALRFSSSLSCVYPGRTEWQRCTFCILAVLSFFSCHCSDYPMFVQFVNDGPSYIYYYFECTGLTVFNFTKILISRTGHRWCC